MTADNMEPATHVDVLIVGAGLSGIGAACILSRDCPDRSLLILEARDRPGGTWDLFRYPGIRSDSDMFTLGFSFKPWLGRKPIAEGAEISAYLDEAAREHGVDRFIRCGVKVTAASWSSADARWTVDAICGPDACAQRFTCAFLYLASGYYDPDAGYRPDFAGEAAFTGRIVHPQHWPEDLDCSGKQVVVIGSGATAVTLAPALARTAAHVVMLQRSPTYYFASPNADGLADLLRRLLPARLAYGLVRWRNVLLGLTFFNLCRRFPARFKRKLIALAQKQLPAGYDVSTHFTPRYNPWEQRLCFVPDGDLFKAIGTGALSIATGAIDRFTGAGVRLASGETLPADIIVTATGLVVKTLGGLALSVDGVPKRSGDMLAYKGILFAGMPNFAVAFGYTNASWTLKSDLTAEYVARLLNHLRKTGQRVCTPVLNDPSVKPVTWIDFSSGYFQRAADILPRQGSKHPWRLYQNYLRDLLMIRHGRLADGVLRFS